jgi:hypothetical protein
MLFHQRQYSAASVKSYIGCNGIGNKIIKLNFYENFCQQLQEGKIIYFNFNLL